LKKWLNENTYFIKNDGVVLNDYNY